MQSEFGHVAQQLLTTISHRNLRTIIRHLVAVVQALTRTSGTANGAFFDDPA